MSLKSHVTFKKINEVRNACAWLYNNMDVTGFSYDLTFKGGKYSGLYDSKNLFEPYYYSDLIPQFADRHGRVLPDGIYTHEYFKKNSHLIGFDAKVSHHIFNTFKSDRLVCILNHYRDYDELTTFYLNFNEIDFHHFLLNNTELFLRFISHFREKMKYAISEISLTENQIHFSEIEKLEFDRSSYSRYKKNFFIDKEKPTLPKQQMICFEKLLTGKCSKIIAYEMQLSTRTVEHYLEVIRKKLECRCTKEIILKYR